MKNEWRVPFTILTFSSLIFTGVTFAFGFTISRTDGSIQINSNDTWSYDPMEIVWGQYWRYWSLLGFYLSLGIFSYAWFEFMKDEKRRNNG
jgi:hypothetical protein